MSKVDRIWELLQEFRCVGTFDKHLKDQISAILAILAEPEGLPLFVKPCMDGYPEEIIECFENTDLEYKCTWLERGNSWSNCTSGYLNRETKNHMVSAAAIKGGGDK